MICKNCGVDCDPEQMFCLRCGTPLDFSSSDDSQQEIQLDENELTDDRTATINLKEDDLNLLINLNTEEKNIKKPYRDSNNMNLPKEQSSKTNNQRANSKNDIHLEEYDNSEEELSFFQKNKLIIIGASVITALILGAIILLLVLGNSKKYEEYYQNGLTFYNKGQVQNSISQFVKAAEVAENDSQRKEVYVKLWEAYSQINGFENDQINVLKKLIELESDNESYYQALIVLYEDMGKESEIDKLIESVSDEELKERLKSFDATMPVPTVVPGEYDKPISVALTGPADRTIYYTINGGKATSSSDTYTKEIDLKEEGEFTIRAVAINKEGKESDQFEGVYKIIFNTVDEPTVNLDSGVYNEQKKIVVKAAKNCKIYYTLDGTTPTTKSKLYKKAIKLPEANSVFTFIAVDENGVYSKPVSRVYDFQRTYTYSFDDARATIASALLNEGIMENSFGSYSDGSQMYIEFDTVVEIDEEFYYIITATKTSENGGVLFEEMYGFNTETSEFSTVTISNGDYILESNEAEE